MPATNITIPSDYSYSDHGPGNFGVYGHKHDTVNLGNGTDTVHIGSGQVSVGNGHDKVIIDGNGTVVAGNGADSIAVGGNGFLTLGTGNDTITLGTGNDTIFTAGKATITGAEGSATIGAGGGEVIFGQKSHPAVEDAVYGKSVTLQGSASFGTEFISGEGTDTLIGKSGSDTFIGGSGSNGRALMEATGSHNLFEFFSSVTGGNYHITGWHTGDQLYLEGYTLAQLTAAGDVTFSGSSTTIHLDHGKTTIQVDANLHGSDVTSTAVHAAHHSNPRHHG